MGCVASKADLNDRHPNIFQVMNIDCHGRGHMPGQLEITESELVLHQRGREVTRWPLRSLRCYGFDAEKFTFESGRRCPTGHGIYSFQCRRAEQVFNLLQGYIQMRNDDATSRDSFAQPSIPNNNNNGYLEPLSGRIPNGRGSLSLPGNVRGPISPTTSLPASYYANEDVFDTDPNERAVDSRVTNGDLRPSYANLTPFEPLPEEDQSHLYVNVMPEASKAHCYANCDAADTEVQVRQVNYILLDLDHGSDSNNSQTLPTTSPAGSVPGSGPSSPRRASEGYVTIDFDKTAALSNSACPSVDHDEGCRKTRHNSAMNDLMFSRNNSSMSD